MLFSPSLKGAVEISDLDSTEPELLCSKVYFRMERSCLYQTEAKDTPDLFGNNHNFI